MKKILLTIVLIARPTLAMESEPAPEKLAEVCNLLINRAHMIEIALAHLNVQEIVDRIPFCRLLIDAGTQVNTQCSKCHAFLECELRNEQIWQILIDSGLNIYARHNSFGRHPFYTYIGSDFFSGIKADYLNSRFLLVPDSEELLASKEIIMTTLLCLNRISPTVPRDIRTMILMKLPYDIGNVMILRKLQGKSIPHVFKETTIRALYYSTLRRRILSTQELSDKKLKTIMINKPCEANEPLKTEMLQNIATRLNRSKLLCNNPDEIAELNIKKGLP